MLIYKTSTSDLMQTIHLAPKEIREETNEENGIKTNGKNRQYSRLSTGRLLDREVKIGFGEWFVF
jgi:hypothetical protein